MHSQQAKAVVESKETKTSLDSKVLKEECEKIKECFVNLNPEFKLTKDIETQISQFASLRLHPKTSISLMGKRIASFVKALGDQNKITLQASILKLDPEFIITPDIKRKIDEAALLHAKCILVKTIIYLNDKLIKRLAPRGVVSAPYEGVVTRRLAEHLEYTEICQEAQSKHRIYLEIKKIALMAGMVKFFKKANDLYNQFRKEDGLITVKAGLALLEEGLSYCRKCNEAQKYAQEKEFVLSGLPDNFLARLNELETRLNYAKEKFKKGSTLIRMESAFTQLEAKSYEKLSDYQEYERELQYQLAEEKSEVGIFPAREVTLPPDKLRVYKKLVDAKRAALHQRDLVASEKWDQRLEKIFQLDKEIEAYHLRTFMTDYRDIQKRYVGEWQHTLASGFFGAHSDSFTVLNRLSLQEEVKQKVQKDLEELSEEEEGQRVCLV